MTSPDVYIRISHLDVDRDTFFALEDTKDTIDGEFILVDGEHSLEFFGWTSGAYEDIAQRFGLSSDLILGGALFQLHPLRYRLHAQSEQFGGIPHSIAYSCYKPIAQYLGMRIEDIGNNVYFGPENKEKWQKYLHRLFEVE